MSFKTKKKKRNCGLFTGQFPIKTRQSNGKGLHGAHWVVIVQCEDVFSHSSKLHHYVIVWKMKRGLSYHRHVCVLVYLVNVWSWNFSKKVSPLKKAKEKCITQNSATYCLCCGQSESSSQKLAWLVHWSWVHKTQCHRSKLESCCAALSGCPSACSDNASGFHHSPGAQMHTITLWGWKNYSHSEEFIHVMYVNKCTGVFSRIYGLTWIMKPVHEINIIFRIFILYAK